MIEFINPLQHSHVGLWNLVEILMQFFPGPGGLNNIVLRIAYSRVDPLQDHI